VGEWVVTIPCVGVGWFAPSCIMSEQEQLPLWGSDGPKIGAGRAEASESLWREVRYLLTISTGSGRGGRLSPTGIVHSLGVCLIEGWNMARGKNGAAKEETQGNLPRFVDVRLTPEQRAEFSTQILTADECAQFIMSATSDGYRIGVSWSGEHQSYTVSMTCRNPNSPNFGLCMTSFAGDLEKAISLANYKHCIVTKEVWLDSSSAALGDFG